MKVNTASRQPPDTDAISLMIPGLYDVELMELINGNVLSLWPETDWWRGRLWNHEMTMCSLIHGAPTKEKLILELVGVEL